MGAIVGGSFYCAAMVKVGIISRIEFVSDIGQMRTVIGRALLRAAMIKVRIIARVELVSDICRMGTIVRRRTIGLSTAESCDVSRVKKSMG